MAGTRKKVGDRIYWEYFDRPGIGSATIKRIEEDSYIERPPRGKEKRIPYNMYYTDDGKVKCVIEDYSCLDASDPKVIEYEEQVSKYIKERTESVHRAVIGDREPTATEIGIIDRTIKYMTGVNLIKELEEKFNYCE